MKALIKYGTFTTMMEIPKEMMVLKLPKPEKVSIFAELDENDIKTKKQPFNSFGFVKTVTMEGVKMAVYDYQGEGVE